jgi:biopolymer transport protein TolR
MGASANRLPNEAITSINMTPLVDVCLVLVIIFMVTAPLIAQNGILANSVKKEVEQPKEKTTQAAKDFGAVYVKINANQSLELNGEKVTLVVLGIKLKNILDQAKEKRVYINAEGKVPYGMVVSVMDVVRGSGAQHLAMLNDQEGILERTMIFK